MSLEQFVGKHITGKGKLSKGYMREVENNKLVFSMIMGKGEQEHVMFITISKENIGFDLDKMDFSKTYIFGGNLTSKDTIEAEYLKLAAIQKW